MATSSRLWRADLFVVVATAVVGLAAVLLDVSGAIRIVLVTPLIVFAPGYAFVGSAFPHRRTPVQSDELGPSESLTDSTMRTRGLLYSVRVALSVAASLGLVAVVALAVSVVGGGFDPTLVSAALFGVTLFLTAVAFARRAALPRSERAGIPSAGRPSPPSFESDSGVSTAVYVVVVVALVAFSGSIAFAVAETGTDQGPPFTEAYLLTENETGEYTARGYPQTLTRGEPADVTLALENHEGERQRYSVVTELQRLESTTNGTRVTEETELARFQRVVEPSETVRIDREITPTMAGERLRLVFLVYRGAAPEDPARTNAYRTVQLVVNVTAAETPNASAATPS